jgi:hypothetical protein
MQNFINTITRVEWGLLGIAVLALLIALMAWRRAGRALQLIKNNPVVEEVLNEKPEQQVEQRPAVSLELTANKNDYDQITLELSNNGLLAARQVKLDIDKPENIYDAESLSSGIESANVTTSSAIMPRLAVLDAENKFPINEILPGKTIELPAALTMSHGKICDFPVTLKWKDENGTSQQKKLTLTV